MTYSSFRLALSASALCAGLAFTAPAFAGGVPAGTLIENTATASFNTGGPVQTIDSNTVTFMVAEVLDVATASQDSGALPITGSTVLTFSVTNTGNGPEAFVLTADPAIAGNDFDVTVDGLAIDTNGNGVYDPGVDTLLANGATSASLDPDASVTVFVLVTVPASVADGGTSQISLLAEAETGTGTPGTTFAGAGESGVDAVVGSSGADSAAPGTLIASIVSVALVKSATVSDPFGGSQPVPGATITYSLTATVAGSGTISDLVIADTIPASTSYVAGTLALDSSPLTDAADADAGEASAAGISVALGTVAAGSSHTVTFHVEIE